MWKLATVEVSGRPIGCLELSKKLYPLSALHPSLPEQTIDLFADWSTSVALLNTAASAIEAGQPFSPVEGRLLAPIIYPGKVICAGANYYDHMAEMGFPNVKKENHRLFFFMKPPQNTVVGPGETVSMPRNTKKLDWEIELAAVIGKTAHHITPDRALEYVAAYTVAIDVSARDFNSAPDQFYKYDWFAGKANDTSCPLGPYVVPASNVDDVQNLSLRLKVNGVVKQDSNTSKMIYSVAEQVARASEIVTLNPGDLLLTGTPSGVGAPQGTFLKVGDQIDAEIGDIGLLSVKISKQS